MRVLVGRDGEHFPPNIADMIRHAGLAIDQVNEFDQVASLARKQSYDLLIITYSATDRRTVELFRGLRRQGCTTPILCVGVGDTQARIEALNAGADDCVSAAVPEDELLARVRALLRRPPLTVGPTYTFGNLVLDSSAASVTCGGDRIIMPRREVALLELLMRSASAPVTRERLEHALFSFDDAATPNALEAAISRLRRRLKASRSTVTITATRGFGYSLEGSPEYGCGSRSSKPLEARPPFDILANEILVDG